MQKDDCLFCKIARGDIPSKKVYEDDEVFAFNDINPAAPVHFLIIPKRHITSLAEVGPEDGELLGKMLVLAKKLALEQGCVNGFRITYHLVDECRLLTSCFGLKCEHLMCFFGNERSNYKRKRSDNNHNNSNPKIN